MNALHKLGATEAAARIADGSLTSEALVRACLDRIADRDAQIRAWAAIDGARAMEQARACDLSDGPRGPLHGVPIGVKDVIDTGDFVTAHGSPLYAGRRPQTDAACIAMLRRAGAVILGKTATAEFASICPPDTRNPVNPSHTPGGSSSGSAAALADDMVPLALGTQTGGSTIRPASFCGVVGFKPTFGLINRSGLKPSAESLDTIGLMARDVTDVSLLFAAVLGQSGPTETSAPPRRIGLCRTDIWDSADPDVRGPLETLARALQSEGVAVADFNTPVPYSTLLKCHGRIMRYENARAMMPEYLSHPAMLSDMFRSRLEEGLSITPDEHAGNLDRMDSARRAFDAAMTGLDALLTLSTTGEAPEGLQSTGDSRFNSVWTLLGMPCVHIPLGRGRTGLPVGVQIVGRRFSDNRLLGIARGIEIKAPMP
jgi:amidase